MHEVHHGRQADHSTTTRSDRPLRRARAAACFLTGTQALVRILLDQRDRDRADGINTAGFVSGYRGSPLGGVDLELWRARSCSAERRIEFLPAVNEDLAATAVLGIAAGRDQSAPRSRWRVRPLVRQGPRRRSLRRRAEARQRLRLLAAWRRAGRRRRRPWLRVVLDAAPVRRRLHGVVHADAAARQASANISSSANMATR